MLKCNKVYVDCGSAPDPAEEFTALSIAAFKGPTSVGREGGEGKVRGREWRKCRVLSTTMYF